MTYLSYGRVGEIPKWRIVLYLVVLTIMSVAMGHAFDPHLYWGIPLCASLLILMFVKINRLVRDAEHRARLVPYAKWLILAGVSWNAILLFGNTGTRKVTERATTSGTVRR